jgi:hypothetical protein
MACLLGRLLMAPPLVAQGTQIALGGGVSFPTSDYNTIAKVGWHATAALSIGKRNRSLGFQIDASYAQFGLDPAGSGASFDVNERFIYGTGDVVYRFDPSESTGIRPYLIAGIGVYNSKGTGSDADLFGDTAATDFGLNAGVGFNYTAGGVTLFLESRFHNIFRDPSNTQYIPLTAGFRLGG